MKKIIGIACLLVFVFSSCTSIFEITTKTVYQKNETVNQIGTVQHIYSKLQETPIVTIFDYTEQTISTISKISYETELDGDLVANIHLADGHIITVSVVNNIMNDPQFLYGKEMTYYKTCLKHDTTYNYQKTTNIVKDGKIVSTTIDTISNFTADIKFPYNITRKSTKIDTTSYVTYYDASKCTVTEYVNTDTTYSYDYNISFDTYKKVYDTIVFEEPLYDTTVTRTVDNAKSKTDVKCIGKRIENETYQLKLCRIEYNANNMPHTVSKWVNTDEETYYKIRIPEEAFILVSDFDKFYNSKNQFLPISYVNHLHSTEKTQIIIKTQD